MKRKITLQITLLLRLITTVLSTNVLRKNKIFSIPLLFLFFFSIETIAQNTSIPDNNFEQALIDLGHDSGAIDGVVTTANISGITTLNVSNKGIVDLTGIEDFTALTDLRCYSNNLTSLDVSANTTLSYLNCYDNSLTSLDVSSNTALSYLDCEVNNLTSLYVSTNTALTTLLCDYNQLTSLDVSANTALTVLECQSNNLSFLNVQNGNNTNVTKFKATNNPNLSCIQVDDASYSTTNWTEIDTTTGYSVACLTSVPDNAFEQALIVLGYDTGALDGVVFTSNIIGLTTLDVSDKGISDLTGIENFVALTTLDCSSNSLTSLDLSTNSALTTLDCFSNSLTNLNVSSNTALIYLSCHSNNLTSLDVSTNTALTTLYCYSNNLTNLDVSSNTALTVLTCYANNLTSLGLSSNTALSYLNCGSNNLTSLDVSSNTVLANLYCNTNNLYSLDVSSNTALTGLICHSNNLSILNVKNGNNINFTHFLVYNNPNLSCIEVDDVGYSTTTWASKDATASYSVACLTYVPDDAFEQALIDLGVDAGPLDDFVPTSNISSLTTLDVSSEGISDLTGIEDFSALTTLRCELNNLTSLDLSTNTALTELRCQINNLTFLNVQNGNNTNTNRVDFYVFDNPDLSCIQVDDVAYSTAYWIYKDDTASYSLACTVLSIEAIEINEYLLYPNPVKDILNIRLNNGSELKQITIYNILGQLVTSTKNLKINTANFKSGVYFVEVETNQGKSAKKIIIE